MVWSSNNLLSVLYIFLILGGGSWFVQRLLLAWKYDKFILLNIKLKTFLINFIFLLTTVLFFFFSLKLNNNKFVVATCFILLVVWVSFFNFFNYWYNLLTATTFIFLFSTLFYTKWLFLIFLIFLIFLFNLLVYLKTYQKLRLKFYHWILILCIVYVYCWFLILANEVNFSISSVNVNLFFAKIINLSFGFSLVLFYFVATALFDKFFLNLVRLISLNQATSLVVKGGFAEDKFNTAVRELSNNNHCLVVTFSLSNRDYIANRFNKEVADFVFRLTFHQLRAIVAKNPANFIFSFGSSSNYGLCLTNNALCEDEIKNKILDIYEKINNVFLYSDYLITAKLKMGISVYNYHSANFWELVRYSAFALDSVYPSYSYNSFKFFTYQEYCSYQQNISKLNFLQKNCDLSSLPQVIFQPVLDLKSAKTHAFLLDNNFHKVDYFVERDLKKKKLWDTLKRYRTYSDLLLYSNSYNHTNDQLFIRYSLRIISQRDFNVSQFIYRLNELYNLNNLIIVFAVKNETSLQSAIENLKILHNQRIKIAFQLHRTSHNKKNLISKILKLSFVSYLLLYEFDFRTYKNLLVSQKFVSVVITNINSQTQLSGIINYPVLVTGKCFGTLTV